MLTMSTMVEQVEQRAKKQQQVGQDTEQVRRVLGQHEESGNSQKGDEHHTAASLAPAEATLIRRLIRLLASHRFHLGSTRWPFTLTSLGSGSYPRRYAGPANRL